MFITVSFLFLCLYNIMLIYLHFYIKFCCIYIFYVVFKFKFEKKKFDCYEKFVEKSVQAKDNWFLNWHFL